MITPSFSITATERVLPKLALDFTTASLDPRVTFTRTTGASNPATYVNGSGYITSATNNQPRFDYDPVTLICKGLLIEESRQNVLPYSSDFTNTAIWLQTGLTVTPNTDISPDGTQNATTVVFSGSNLSIQQLGTVNVTGQTVTGSIYIKGTAGETIQIAPGGVDQKVTLDGTWQRISATKTAINNRFNINTYGGSTARTIKIWGAQMEVGAFATSYIPTTTTALTRNADVATMTGTNFSSWFNASEGSIVVNATKTISGNFPAYYSPFSINDGTSQNVILVSTLAGSNALYPDMRVSGAGQLDFVSGNLVSGSAGIAIGYKANSTQFAIGSSAKTTDTTCSIPTVTALNIGNTLASNFWNGYISKVAFYNQRLTSAELAAFTK